jgi:hypothetical protein
LDTFELLGAILKYCYFELPRRDVWPILGKIGKIEKKNYYVFHHMFIRRSDTLNKQRDESEK